MADNDVYDEDEATTIGMLIDETLSCNQLCSLPCSIYIYIYV